MSKIDGRYNIENINSSHSDSEKKVRKIQTIHGNSTFILVLPRDFVKELHIEKGDYVKCSISENCIIVEKLSV